MKLSVFYDTPDPRKITIKFTTEESFNANTKVSDFLRISYEEAKKLIKAQVNGIESHDEAKSLVMSRLE